MNNDTPAWKKIFTVFEPGGVVTLIIVIGIIALFVGLVMIISWSGGRTKQFATECTVLDGFVVDINEVTVCAAMEAVDGVLWSEKLPDPMKYHVSHACRLAGGRMLNLSSQSHDIGCYKVTVFKELGARHDYRPSN